MHTSTFIGRPVRGVAVATLIYLIGAALFAGFAQAKTSVKGEWIEGAQR